MDSLMVVIFFSSPSWGTCWFSFLWSLVISHFNSQEIFLNFFSKGKEVELRGIVGKPGKIISSNVMTKLLKKEQWHIIAQLCSLEVPTSKSSISADLQKFMDNHSKFFEAPKGLPPIHDHDHAIHLIPRSFFRKIRPYRYPYVQTSEIEHMIA